MAVPVENKPKEIRFQLTFHSIYTLIRDMALIVLLIVCSVLYFSNRSKEIINITYSETMNLFYDTYAPETQLLNQQILRAREDRIRIQFEKDIREKYGFSVFSPAERMKYKANTNG